MKKKFLSLFVVIMALFVCTTAVIAAEFSTESEATVIDGKIVIHTEYSQALDNEFLSVALYDTDSRLLDYFIVPALYGRECTDIVLDDIQTATNAKLFIMADKTRLSPLSVAETVAIDRTGEGDEVVVPADTKLVVVTPDKNGEYFDETTVNGVKTTYVYAWVDGELQWIALDTEAEIYIDKDATKTIYEAIEDGTLLNKLAISTVDTNGLYTIMPRASAYDVNGEFLGIVAYDADVFADEKNDEIQGYTEHSAGYLVKYAGIRYSLNKTAKLSGTQVEPFDYVIGPDTKIVIRNEYVNTNGKSVLEFIEVTPESLTSTIEQKLENIQVVVQNNTNSTTEENLVLLFAEVNGEKFELGSAATFTKKSERIVKNINYDINEDGGYYAVYDLLNPYTGASEYGVAGTEVGTKNYKSTLAIGEVVELENGKVNDEAAGVALKNETVYFVVDYVASENALEVIEVPAVADLGEGTLEDYIDENSTDIIRLNVEDAAVSVLTGKLNTENTYLWGTFQSGYLSKLDGSDKSYLAYNANYEVNDEFKTVYGKYVKVVLGLDDDIYEFPNKYGFNGDVKYIIVNVHSGEEIEFCKLK